MCANDEVSKAQAKLSKQPFSDIKQPVLQGLHLTWSSQSQEHRRFLDELTINCRLDF